MHLNGEYLKTSLTIGLILSLSVLAIFIYKKPLSLERSRNWSVRRWLDYAVADPGLKHAARNYCVPLEGRELGLYSECSGKTDDPKWKMKFGSVVKGDCCFMSGKGRQVIGLASFPGSGNTWLRGLLEKATGVCTGAIYCDGGLLSKGFNGEGVVGPSVVVVKSHSVRPKFNIFKDHRQDGSKIYFDAAVVLLRNPKNAMIAEWHRRKTKRMVNSSVSNHFLSTGRQDFGVNPEWMMFVESSCTRWKQFVTGWAINGIEYPIHYVRYEDLVSSASDQVAKIVQFLAGINNPLPFRKAELEAGFEQFHRKHSLTRFSHFTSSQADKVELMISQAISKLHFYYPLNSTIIQHLQSYLTCDTC